MPFVTWSCSSLASVSLLPRSSLQENQTALESDCDLFSLAEHQEDWRNTSAVRLMMSWIQYQIKDPGNASTLSQRHLQLKCIKNVILLCFSLFILYRSHFLPSHWTEFQSSSSLSAFPWILQNVYLSSWAREIAQFIECLLWRHEGLILDHEH